MTEFDLTRLEVGMLDTNCYILKHRESRAAAASKTGLFDIMNDCLRRQVQCSPKGGVTVANTIILYAHGDYPSHITKNNAVFI